MVPFQRCASAGNRREDAPACPETSPPSARPPDAATAGAAAPGRCSRWRPPRRRGRRPNRAVRRAAAGAPTFGARFGTTVSASERIVIHSVRFHQYISMYSCLPSPMKTRRRRHPRADRPRAAHQPGAPAPPPAPAGIRGDAGDDFARHHGPRPGEALGRRRLPAAWRRNAGSRDGARRAERAASEFLRNIERVQQLVIIRSAAARRRRARPRRSTASRLPEAPARLPATTRFW